MVGARCHADLESLDETTTRRTTVTAKKPPNAGKPWTSADDQKLKQEAKGNTPTRLIGLHLGRSEDSVRSRASDLDVSLKPTNQSPYGTRKK
jgi:hypothetical protein